MVKGTTRQVVLVRACDSPLFEQAIFFTRDSQGVDAAALLSEAERLAAHSSVGSRRPKLTGPLLWVLCGALPVAAAWLCTALLGA